MAEFLFEIFCEEIPARMQQRAGLDLTKAITNGLAKAGITLTDEHCYTGPRRLVFTADLPLKSPDVNEERKGPRIGAPEQALAGFLKAAGLSDISQAQTKSDKKGEFYVAITSSKGRPTADILLELIPAIMNDFPWPKSMKSGSTSFRWVRPLTSMICLLDGAVIPVQAGGITAGGQTGGHRRHGKGPYTVTSFADYRAQLESKGHVMICTCERKEKILTDARKACADKGLELVEDEGLLNEVAGLTEWPVVLLGDMDESFLELPDEVIRLTLKSHQKTFTVRDPKTGSLAAHFIIVANQIAPDGGEAIKKGNGKVISARLSDAQFFQTEDAKKKLEDYYEKLGTVVFHKKLGSIQDKAERVAALAKELAPKVGADPVKAERAARLAKCDLVTQTVIEFTSLQGQIGAQMYRAENGSAQGGGRIGSGSDIEDIAIAIEQHYKPAGPSDAVPTNPVAVVVALADKLDSLVGFWAIDEKPTGSKDPYALRRAALGVVRIILENDVRLNSVAAMIVHFVNQITKDIKIVEVLEGSKAIREATTKGAFSAEKSLKLISSNHVDFVEEMKLLRTNGFNESVSLVDEVLSFITDRLKVYLRDQGMRHDIIDAVLSNGGDDLVSIVNRVTALQDFLSTDDGENLLAGYKRAANILKSEAKKAKADKQSLPEGAPKQPADAYGAALFDGLETASKGIETALKGEDYAAAMGALAKLREPIDAFFTHVQVISDDTAVKENNLRLLLRIRDTARQIADFEAIQG